MLCGECDNILSTPCPARAAGEGYQENKVRIFTVLFISKPGNTICRIDLYGLISFFGFGPELVGYLAKINPINNKLPEAMGEVDKSSWRRSSVAEQKRRFRSLPVFGPKVNGYHYTDQVAGSNPVVVISSSR